MSTNAVNATKYLKELFLWQILQKLYFVIARQKQRLKKLSQPHPFVKKDQVGTKQTLRQATKKILYNQILKVKNPLRNQKKQKTQNLLKKIKQSF